MSKPTFKDVVDAHTDWQDTNDFVAKKNGITRDYLFKRLKRELNAAETIHVPSGKTVDGEAILKKKKMPLWGTQQKARMDAHKLLDHYPSDKTDINLSNPIPVEVYTGRPPPEED